MIVTEIEKNANSLFVMYSNCLCVRNKKKKKKKETTTATATATATVTVMSHKNVWLPFHLVQFIKCWRIQFRQLNSKVLYLSLEEGSYKFLQ